MPHTEKDSRDRQTKSQGKTHGTRRSEAKIKIKGARKTPAEVPNAPSKRRRRRIFYFSSFPFVSLLFICPRHTERLKPIKTHTHTQEKERKTDIFQVLMLLLFTKGAGSKIPFPPRCCSIQFQMLLYIFSPSSFLFFLFCPFAL
jgi:hypothetical protein